MKLLLAKNSISVSTIIFIQDPNSGSGSGLTGITPGVINAAYYKSGSSTYEIINLQSTTVGDWVSGGLVEINSANLPGLYQLDLPDAVLRDDSSTGADISVVVMLTSDSTTIVPCILEIQLLERSLDDIYDVNVVEVMGETVVGGTPDVNTTKISGSTTAADNLEASITTAIIGSAIAGTLDSTHMTTDLTSAENDFYNGRVIIWTSGDIQYIARAITDYDGGTKKCTFAALPGALVPAVGDDFVIV